LAFFKTISKTRLNFLKSTKYHRIIFSFN